MPRAVLISVGELSLEPLKTLVESNGVTTASIAVTDTASLESLEALTNNLSEQEQHAECLLVQANNNAEKNVSAFTSVATHLIYSSPETYLTQCLVANQTNENADAATQLYIQQYSRHVQSALNALEQDSALNICSIDDILANSAAFMKTVFGKDSQETKAVTPPSLVYKAMALSAAAALVDKDELYELYDDALSVGQLFGEFSVHLSPDSDTFKNKVSVLSQVAKAIQQKNQQISTLNQQAKESTAKLSEKETQFSQLTQQISEQKTKAEEENRALSSEIEEQKQALNKASEQLTAKEKECSSLEQGLDVKTNELLTKAKEAAESKAKLDENETQSNQLTQQLAEKTEQIAKADEQNSALSSELEKQKQALAKASEQLTLKEKELATLQQNLNVRANEIGAKAKEADEAKAKLSEKEKQCNQLTQQLAEQKQEAELSQLQVIQLQEELDAAVQKANKLSPIEQALKASNEKASKLQAKLTSTEAEQKPLMLQITQLQEKLEATAQKANKLAPIEQALKTSNEKASKLQAKLTSIEEEQKLLLSQTTQLQEELEATAQKAIKLEPADQALSASNKQILQLQKKLTCANEEAQLATLQIAQLQEELERTVSEYEAVKVKEKEATAELSKQLEANKQFKALQAEHVIRKEQLLLLQRSLETAGLEKSALEKTFSELKSTQKENSGVAVMNSEKLQNAELELELASLQISQLQEELEHYYIALQKSEHSLKKELPYNTMSGNKIQTKVFDMVTASELSITGKYLQGDYQDVHLTLHSVTFPNGNQVESVKVKLVNVAGHIGIEFRAQENEGLFREFEDSSDEYGAYLRYFLTAPENLQAQQQKTVERLNASERLLIMGCINVIAEQLQNTNISTSTEVTSEQWREWRKAAIALSNHIDTLPNWLSFDSVQLREEFATDGYEHLWLVFNGVLVGNVWRNTLEFKLSASNVGMAQNGEFSDAINIEFRELDDGSAPLMTWPPETADEYGPKLNVAINNLTLLNDFANHDKQLISHLVNNVTSILEKLEVDDSDMSRSKSAWASAITALLAEEGATEGRQTFQGTVKSEQEVVTEAQNTLVCDEVVSVGSYQHLVFTQKGNDTKIKLRAENVNPETFDAEVYLELRDGTNNVIYNGSEFFGEDDYGPRVKIPAETLEALQHENQEEQFLWAISVYQDIPENLGQAENIDELVKLLWKNILDRKSKK